MTVIYIDILLSLNMFIDFLLLASTARVLNLPVKRFRLILGSFAGALTSLIILLPPMTTMISLLLKLVGAAAMIAIAVTATKPALFCKATVVLFVISAIFSGICSGGYYLLAPTGLFVQSGVVYYNVPPLLLVVLTTVAYGVLCIYEHLTRKRAARGYAYRIELIDGDDRIVLRALMDSGHSLTDSFSGAPVILAKESTVRVLRDRYDALTVGGHVLGKIRYIPYSSIGGDGILTAFRPEHITLYANGKQLDISGTWVATTTVLGRGEYDALIGPAIADRLFDT